MRLYIVRHAIATPRGIPGTEDDNRSLTEKGIEKMRKAARGLNALGYIPDFILCSPLLRARQTGDILISAFAKKVEMKLTPNLAPAAHRRDLYREIAGFWGKVDSLMLVGHQPSLGEIAGEIVWGTADRWIDLKKGGACAIDVNSVRGIPGGRLLSLLTPLILRKIGP